MNELERRCLIEEHVPERLGPRLSSPGERERNAVMANRVGVNMLQFCSVSNSLSHATFSIKWEVYFSKELCRSSLLCRRYYSACICVCIVSHGYTTAAVVSLLLNGCITWTLTKRREKKLDGICKIMLRAILNKSWKPNTIKNAVWPPTSHL